MPWEIFFERGIAKVKIALAQGKTFSDKREAIKKRDWQRDKARLMAHYNSKNRLIFVAQKFPLCSAEDPPL